VERIQTDKKVTLKYTMKTHLADGVTKEQPEEQMTFIFGVERQAPSIEKALEECGVGDKIHITIPPSEIYGEHDVSLVRELPRKGLIKQRLKEGHYYRQMRMGSLISFRILEIRSKTVLADFNKPMAGISVSLDVEILAVKEATKKEIDAAIDAQVKRSIGCG
jgi:FKBP-type peptidyl-prolyl cis-trans isomerase SlyD